MEKLGWGMADQVELRKVSVPLAIGIFIFPLLFSWFVLKKGYSVIARLVSFGWLVLMVVLVVANGADKPGGVASTDSTPTPVVSDRKDGVSVEPQKAVEITAYDLAVAYQSNEVAAQKKYGDRALSVTGKVEAITLDVFDNPVIEMRGINEYLNVQASFSKDYSDKLSEISKGSNVTVFCNEVAEVIGTPMLSDCKL